MYIHANRTVAKERSSQIDTFVLCARGAFTQRKKSLSLLCLFTAVICEMWAAEGRPRTFALVGLRSTGLGQAAEPPLVDPKLIVAPWRGFFRSFPMIASHTNSLTIH